MKLVGGGGGEGRENTVDSFCIPSMGNMQLNSGGSEKETYELPLGVGSLPSCSTSLEVALCQKKSTRVEKKSCRMHAPHSAHPSPVLKSDRGSRGITFWSICHSNPPLF